MSELVGQTLEHYRIVEKIGQGGMGEVYRAHDERLDRDVAIKVLPEAVANDLERMRRFDREAKALAALNHPNIATVYGLETAPSGTGSGSAPEAAPGRAERETGRTFLVMELLEGETLRQRIPRGGLGWKKTSEVAAAIAGGLAAAHGKGIVHRDLKPENVFITFDGRVKILDFGLARVQDPVQEDAETATMTPAGTAPGTVMGTVGYMSPEQVRGLPTDGRSDLFALGSLMHEMLTGRSAFARGSAADTSAAILKEEPPSLSSIGVAVPAELERAISRCLEKQPEARFQSAADLAYSLRSITADQPLITAKPSRHRRVVLAVVGIACALGVAALVVLFRARTTDGLVPGQTSNTAHSLAVLPLQNLTGDPDQAFLVDGLHEELIATFARISAFDKVIARTSVMAFRDSDVPIREIGRELGVDLVLEGSVRRSGNRIRATLELIDAKTEDHLWANSFESDLTDILALQSDVARSVVSEVDLALTPKEAARLASARTVDPRAHEAYLKGSYHWKKLTAQDLDVAEHYFNLALEYDPSFAPAYQGLAWVWSGREVVGLTTPEEAGPKAKAAAERAIELDPSSAEAHEALALVKMATDWDWEGARPEWRRALELNPNSANTHAYYAHFLALTGRVDEAVRHSERSIELDPVNSLFRSLQAVVLDIDRRFDDALAAARAALEIQPDNMVAISVMVDVAPRRGVEEEGIETTKRYVSVQYPESKEALEECWTKGDYREVMGCVGATLAKRSQTTYVIPFDVAMFFAAAHDGERTINWLEKGYEQHDPNLPYLALSVLDVVRSDPRFQDLRRRMNLPESSSTRVRASATTASSRE